MSSVPSLAAAPFLSDPAVRGIFGALADPGEESRAIGGAVRDALLGLPVRDIDFATTARPATVERLAAAAGIKTVPTGADHGTITLVVDGRGYEVTTLRQDIATDGRHAVVQFGRDWTADALRRDFTINALSADADGTVHDPLGGYADLAVRRIRFIGDPDQRIAEDRLRVLRFFRFLATFAEGEPDGAGLSAAIRARHSLKELSAERVGEEMGKLVVGRRAAEVAQIMEDSGILQLILLGVARLAPFRRLPAIEGEFGVPPAPELRLLVLGCRISEDVERLAERLRLSGAQRRRMEEGLRAAPLLQSHLSERAARRVLHRVGAAAFADGVLLAAALAGEGIDHGWKRLAQVPQAAPVPAFALTGRDVLAVGVPAGPRVGSILAAVEAWWIEEDFRPDAAALRRHLQEMVQSAQ